MQIRQLVIVLCISTILFSCNNGGTTTTSEANDNLKIDGHPAWILQGNIYEVNVRQYTPEGTFKAFEKHLDRLKEMGVQTLWFMPITPIGIKDRKGHLGSYYAVKDYTAVNPEFGTLEDWKHLVNKCHEMGFKVITDWVANHTSADHAWLEKYPDFYVRDSATGVALSPFDWTDARKLNYKNAALQDSMIKSLQYWIRETNIDGYRCDVAEEVPAEFWKKAIDTLRGLKNVFMLAEGNKGWLHTAGFDATYTWDAFGLFNKIVKGERTNASIDSVLAKVDSTFPANALRLYFTSNHDENSWNKADYGTTPGASHAPFAVLTQTLKASVPLIYSGQEEPFLDSLSFFYKDTILFGKFERTNLYKKLLDLRKSNAALAANAAFIKINTGADDKIFAFTREKDNKKILVVLNLSAAPQKAIIDATALAGEPTELFSGQKQKISDKTNINLKEWDYKVYVY